MPIDPAMDLFRIAPVSAPGILFGGDPAGAARTVRTGNLPEDSKRLEETAKKFEGLLIHQILKQMKEATAQLEPDEEEEWSEASSGEQIQSMFWTFLGEAVTERGGFGLWESIYHQMASAQAVKTAGSAGLDERI